MHAPSRLFRKRGSRPRRVGLGARPEALGGMPGPPAALRSEPKSFLGPRAPRLGKRGERGVDIRDSHAKQRFHRAGVRRGIQTRRAWASPDHSLASGSQAEGGLTAFCVLVFQVDENLCLHSSKTNRLWPVAFLFTLPSSCSLMSHGFADKAERVSGARRRISKVGLPPHPLELPQAERLLSHRASR